ncbi:hypothetical protein G7Y79_00055g090050 [Physcia stellaris]|nr:hypothetical protein G7Y79_00055g090050 [Physcia stellaris]
MSFGFSVGDFVAVVGICWKVYKRCKESSGNYAELSSEVGALHIVLKETEELLSQQDLTSQQKERLAKCRKECDAVLQDLSELLLKYESLGTKSQRTFDRLGFGIHDMDAIKLRLISNVSMLDAVNNACSHARLEKRLNLFIAEIRAGRREGSIVSVQTIDTVARNNQEKWDVLRRDLEDVGISPAAISENRQFIIAWFREAVAAGRIEEDVPSADDESSVLLQELNNDSGDSDTASDSSIEVSTREVSHSRSVFIIEPSTIAAMESVNAMKTGPRYTLILTLLNSKSNTNQETREKTDDKAIHYYDRTRIATCVAMIIFIVVPVFLMLFVWVLSKASVDGTISKTSIIIFVVFAFIMIFSVLMSTFTKTKAKRHEIVVASAGSSVASLEIIDVVTSTAPY